MQSLNSLVFQQGLYLKKMKKIKPIKNSGVTVSVPQVPGVALGKVLCSLKKYSLQTINTIQPEDGERDSQCPFSSLVPSISVLTLCPSYCSLYLLEYTQGKANVTNTELRTLEPRHYSLKHSIIFKSQLKPVSWSQFAVLSCHQCSFFVQAKEKPTERQYVSPSQKKIDPNSSSPKCTGAEFQQGKVTRFS